jgi:hypothetical protein
MQKARQKGRALSARPWLVKESRKRRKRDWKQTLSDPRSTFRAAVRRVGMR